MSHSEKSDRHDLTRLRRACANALSTSDLPEIRFLNELAVAREVLPSGLTFTVATRPDNGATVLSVTHPTEGFVLVNPAPLAAVSATTRYLRECPYRAARWVAQHRTDAGRGPTMGGSR